MRLPLISNSDTHVEADFHMGSHTYLHEGKGLSIADLLDHRNIAGFSFNRRYFKNNVEHNY